MKLSITNENNSSNNNNSRRKSGQFGTLAWILNVNVGKGGQKSHLKTWIKEKIQSYAHKGRNRKKSNKKNEQTNKHKFDGRRNDTWNFHGERLRIKRTWNKNSEEKKNNKSIVYGWKSHKQMHSAEMKNRIFVTKIEVKHFVVLQPCLKRYCTNFPKKKEYFKLTLTWALSAYSLRSFSIL